MPERSANQEWRLTVAIFTSSLFIDLLAWGHTTAFTPLYLQQELGVPPGQVPVWAGVLAAAPLAVAVPISPFWGVLGERYSRKAVIVRAEFAYALGYALAALAGGPWGLLLSRLAFGFTFGNVAVMLATQSLLTPPRRLGTALGIIQAAQPAAMAVSPLLGALLIQLVGLRGLWLVDCLAVLASGASMLLFLRDPDLPRSPEPVLHRVRQMASVTVSQPTVRWAFVAWFLLFAGSGATDPFIPVLIQHAYPGANPALAIGIILGAYGMATSVGTILVGRLTDAIRPTIIVLVSSAMLAATAAALGFSPTLVLLAILVVLRAVPQSGTGPALYLHLARVLPPQIRASIMGFTPFPRNLAYLLGPLVAAAVSGFGLGAVFFFSAVCYSATVWVAWLLDRAPPFVTPKPRSVEVAERG